MCASSRPEGEVRGSCLEECGQQLRLWAGVSSYVRETPAMLNGARDERIKEEDPGSGEVSSCAAKRWKGTLQS